MKAPPRMAAVMQLIGRSVDSRGSAQILDDSQLNALLALHDELMATAASGETPPEDGSIFGRIRNLLRNLPRIGELDDIAMYMAHEFRICRGEEGIVAGLAEERGVSRQQADKKIKKGRLILHFHRLGKRSIMPSGRKAEKLMRGVPQPHWIPCWEYVLGRAEANGKVSSDDVESAMTLYKAQNGLMNVDASSETETVDQAVLTEEPKALEGCDLDVFSQILGLFSTKNRDRFFNTLQRRDPLETLRKIFVRMQRQANNKRNEAAAELLLTIRASDPAFMEAMDKIAGALLLQELERQTLQYAVQLEKAKRRPKTNDSHQPVGINGHVAPVRHGLL